MGNSTVILDLDGIERDAKNAAAPELRGHVAALLYECRQLRRDVVRHKTALFQTSHEVEVILAPALGYPLFDGSDPAYQTYDIGDHTPGTLAAEAASVILQHKELHD